MLNPEELDELFEKPINKADDFVRLLELISNFDDEIGPAFNSLKILITDIRDEIINIHEKLRNK